MKSKQPKRKNAANRTIPDALANFDSLPDSAHVRQPVLEGLLSCSGPTVWRRVKDGKIPPPEKFGPRISAWNVGKLRRALSLQALNVTLLPDKEKLPKVNTSEQEPSKSRYPDLTYAERGGDV